MEGEIKMDSNTVLINLTVDENLRTIAIPTNGVVFGVVGDVEVNRVMFVLPQYFREFDLTEFTARVNYSNANGDANYYEADDITDTDGNCTFTWLMGSDVTAYVGDVMFSITLYKKEGDTVTHKFNTRTATGRVLDGYEVEKQITPEQQKTLVSQISEEVKVNLDEYVGEKFQQIETNASNIETLNKDLNDLDTTTVLRKTGEEKTVLVDTTQVTFTKDEEKGYWKSAKNAITYQKNLPAGEKYIVEIDGKEYIAGNNMYNYMIPNGNGKYYGYQGIGNITPVVSYQENWYSSDDKLPFLILQDLEENTGEVYVYLFEDKGLTITGSHNIKITKFIERYDLDELPYEMSYNSKRLFREGVGKKSVVIGGGSYCTAELAYAEGLGNTVSGVHAHAEGALNTVSGAQAHAEGQLNESSGYQSHAEGYKTIAKGNRAHSEGNGTQAIKNYSHAEGYYTVANAGVSHVEGFRVTANGFGSHVGGIFAVSDENALMSFSHGLRTTSIANGQFVIGYGNNPQNDSIFEVGNGLNSDGNPNNEIDINKDSEALPEPTTRQNAFRVTQAGVAIAQTGLQIGDTSVTENQLKSIKKTPNQMDIMSNWANYVGVSSLVDPRTNSSGYTIYSLFTRGQSSMLYINNLLFGCAGKINGVSGYCDDDDSTPLGVTHEFLVVPTDATDFYIRYHNNDDGANDTTIGRFNMFGVTDNTTDSCNIMFFGDEFLIESDLIKNIDTWLKHYNTTPTYIGTLTDSNDIKHECRKGWNIDDYLTRHNVTKDDGYSGVNPFTSSEGSIISASTYRGSTGISDEIDVVIIALARSNDMNYMNASGKLSAIISTFRGINKSTPPSIILLTDISPSIVNGYGSVYNEYVRIFTYTKMVQSGIYNNFVTMPDFYVLPTHLLNDPYYGFTVSQIPRGISDTTHTIDYCNNPLKLSDTGSDAIARYIEAAIKYCVQHRNN